MSDYDLEGVFSGESERVEWKESDRDTSALLQAVCALANDLEHSRGSGFVAIGVRKDGSIAGTGVDDAHVDEATQRLVNRLTSSRILPNPSLTVRRVQRAGLPVWLVQVEPYAVPPVVQVDGVAWVRKGTSTRRATEADLVRLRERRPEHSHPWDMRPVPGADLEALDLRELRTEYGALHDEDPEPETFPSFEEWLTQREFGRARDGCFTPFAATLLLRGRNPQGFVPGAFVEFVRYVGTGVDGPVAWRRTITGALPDQLETLWAQIAAHVAEIAAPEAGMLNPYVPEYPLEALRELARNMVQHRLYEGTHAPARVEWFDDRLVFINPGGPFGRASEGEFGTHADYRNPAVTRGLVELGYVERLGRGVRLVRALLQRHGHPPLEVEVDGFTSITVRGLRS